MAQLIKAVIDTQKNSYRSIGQVSAGDDLELELTIQMNGQSIEFINPQAELLMKKADNNKVRQTKDIIYQDGKFKIKVDEQGVTYPGIVTNQLVINDEGRVSTCLFYFNVGASLEREVLQSISKVETLEQLDEYVVTAFSNLDEYETRLTELDGTMKTTNEEITVNESERKANESERKTNETLRIENEKERVKKENERSEAEIDRKESELDRIKNENARRIAENTRIARENARENAEVNRNAIFEENEVIRNEAEKLREKAEAKRKENFSNLESLNEKLNEAEAERVRAEGNRESKETERQLAESEREKAEANRENTYTNFNDAEVDRRNNENARIQAENLRVQAESIRSERFETAQSTRETKFEESQNTRDELFKASETARATEEIAREKAESIREGNEAIRVNSESLRESAENARQQEEIKRSQAEVLRVEAEKERELSYEEIKKDNSTFKDNINSQYEDIVTEFDKVIANVTNGNENATNSEIVQARGKEVNLNARLDNFDEQLDTNTNENNYFKDNYYYGDYPIVTFIDDDGYKRFSTELKPIFDQYNIKCSLGVISTNVGWRNRLNINELKDLENQGFDIFSHSKTHSSVIFKDNKETATEDEIEAEFLESKMWLKNNGFKNYDLALIYPFGAYYKWVDGVKVYYDKYKNIARKHYKYAIDSIGTTFNECPCDNICMQRHFLNKSIDDNSTIIKGHIYDTCLNNGFLILGTHSGIEEQIDGEYLKEIVEYCISRGAKILPLSEALKIKGNIVSAGDFSNENSFFIGANGVIKQKEEKFTIVDTKIYGNFNFDIDISKLEKYREYIYHINGNGDIFSNKGGVLRITRLDDWFSYMTFISSDGMNTYQRFYDNSIKSWKSWYKISGVTVE